jgi:membrane-associated phospholipid phosphatase
MTWMLVLAGIELVGFALVWHFFVRSEHGQILDTMALTGNTIGQARIEHLVGTVLNTISAVSVAIATIAVGFIALARRRVAVAFAAVLLIVGASATTWMLKKVIYRPNLGVDPERLAAGNSLPSGHVAVVASVAVALVLVLPAQRRGIAAIVGAIFAAGAGAATMSADWHRPSDAVAALLVVGVWACAASLFILVAQRGHGGVEYGPPHRVPVVALIVAGLILLVGAAIALNLTDQVLSVPPDELGRRRLLVAYGGGALGIAGTASLLLASVLGTVHRVVPAVMSPSAETERNAANI